jgi:predicted metal-dependent RNase
MIISVYRQTPELVDWDVEVVVAILKRIRKSIRVRNKRGGIRGYLNFIGEFIP